MQNGDSFYVKYKESVKFGENRFFRSKVSAGGEWMKVKLLLIEDDAAIGRIVKDTMEQEGYLVTWATTGLEGLADFQEQPFDLVLVDWMLPEMDGLTVCQNIRWESDVPILMMSARKEEADKVEGLQGADDYIAKPFSLEELKARVASHLRRWRRYNKQEEVEEQTAYANGLIIDWQREIVSINQQEIALTQKEFALVKLLAKNPSQTFTKKELYQYIWQQATLEDTHTVTVHIKALREKLNDSVRHPYFIQTVWGRGYRFIGEPL
ncbi:DNA-binding response regulator, OmpR family, contains REC and winged-helix (wHTH) domain [Lysinibacillus fusiformis]|uniref:DNA-binding response regulator, OmpR family, contains REC and winged-helix (WHTH) domain n=2 Tax=Bacillaceae TaxID=186817 RepID=A0A1H8ZST8_9BACI|nr:two-component response regulator [Bacillus sp. B14905]SCX67839.1 DNA-binding response regulator, OmpR family, contains REC and winged-helix (wHTH) domain [Lysinibacillus fusiformis]SCX88649.1 DNA-binding response regulator, OmpR family, contains REC and winged-helix (wHTH) domain [Lysinibacillus fusiformis]SDB54988.1 DNA-binding response regulator, OmpR family, contains REC and winged-helix (wHTH) domain [Lysinibacillus fusiformis]SEM85877.1 DNA-binding response regulator, OmpR family, conta